MCSVLEGGDVLPESRPSVKADQKCKKCDEKATVITKIKDAYCRECFILYCVHKLRSAFGKSRVVRDGDLVLLAFSGGAGATALQHLIQEGKSERTQRKLRFTPALVYIDESTMLGLSDEERNRNNQNVIAKMKETNLKAYCYSIEQAYSPSLKPQPVEESIEESMANMSLSEGGDSTKITAAFREAKSLTAKENLAYLLRQQLLTRVAMTLQHNKVLLGDSGTRLAIRLLSDVTQGKGAHLPLEMSFNDQRHPEVAFLRPMREFSSKEIAMYNTLNSLETVFFPAVGTKAPTLASLERLTEDFVTGLQADYPNTVSTIFRTGEKMALVKPREEDDDNYCSMCHAPLDTDTPNCSAMAAIAFSQSLASKQKASNQSPSNSNATNQAKASPISTNQAEAAPISANQSCCNKESTNQSCDSNQTAECCGNGDGSCKTTAKTSAISRDGLRAFLCYGCRLVTGDMPDITSLPPVVLEDAAKRNRRNEMKASIKAYLLDE